MELTPTQVKDLQDEQSDLNKRIAGRIRFINSDEFKALTPDEQLMFREEKKHMLRYEVSLVKKMEYLGVPFETERFDS